MVVSWSVLSSSFNVPSFPLLGLDVTWVAFTGFYTLPYFLRCFAFSCMSSSTILHQVFLVPPTGLLLSTSSSIALLSMLFSSLRFTWSNHLNLVFLNLCSRFSTPRLLLTSSISQRSGQVRLAYSARYW